MANQKGAALIVVLSLLVGSLVIGLSSMQSSLVDERLAGNQKLASEVQMAAEEAAAIGLERFRDISSMSGAEPGDDASVLFGILVSDDCDIYDLFLDIDSVVPRHEIKSSIISSHVPDWSDMLDDVIDSGSPCPSYSGWPADETHYEEPDYSAIYSDIKTELSVLCEAPIQCAYRFVMFEGNPYVLGVAHYEENGQVLAESRPVFVELELSDPPSNLSWIFDAPPITLLSYIANLSVNGANNLTLEGVNGPDILADAGNVDALYQGFLDGNENNIKFEPEVAEIDLNEFGLSDLIPVIQTLKELSDMGAPGITFVTENPDMDAVEDGVLVVGSDFVWNGTHDFNGTIIVLGPSADYNGMGQSEFLGSFIHAPLKLKYPEYGWLDADEYVDFSKVEEFKVDDWRFLESTDTTQTSFDFNGLGKALLKNDSDVLIGVSDNVYGELADADVVSWEQD
ncbi:PilX N-terminal domain-containing pilus assembly protein [Halomonas sp. 25-S5]|uniref:pilus assembly PilX family protein n=1 Tax=Halomonas sp. 25-S5 TaxID=2994065 RepID=UPI002468CC4A|nr:PilX N-terminal domain-containing pilus assembly protein [Halomonas sp. 25-S5]